MPHCPRGSCDEIGPHSMLPQFSTSGCTMEPPGAKPVRAALTNPPWIPDEVSKERSVCVDLRRSASGRTECCTAGSLGKQAAVFSHRGPVTFVLVLPAPFNSVIRETVTCGRCALSDVLLREGDRTRLCCAPINRNSRNKFANDESISLTGLFGTNSHRG